ncbi:TraL conjugative transposon family protein [Bacteroides sp. UBA939]|uniref:TraL conjugative transposon family protein n=1 Tax=Bacteroides sp. UBA939 TaxID=1946092 RepID=UPI0025B7FFE1|nr:TraL conjugative transposon family protein [Bacteroides sp. UBA939]
MKYLKHIFKELGYSINDRLRRMCGGLSEDTRLMVILSMLLIFTVGNLYFSISTIYNWGHRDGRKEIPEMQHIEGLGIMDSDAGNDSNNINRMELVDSPIDNYLQDVDSIKQLEVFDDIF